MGTLKQRRNGPLYSNTVISTLAVDGWAVTFGTARRGLGGLRPRPIPSSLYQMQQPTRQRPVYQLHIIQCGTIIASNSKGLTLVCFAFGRPDWLPEPLRSPIILSSVRPSQFICYHICDHCILKTTELIRMQISRSSRGVRA